ncbi:hypothetical protein ACHAPO_005306 [Fusarium lateritium]
MSEARKHWGLSCTNGGQFYICEDDDTQFVGCCVNDPCGKNNGTCPDGDLRATTFDSDSYSDLPSQDCDNSQGVDNWYTCAFTNPPFLGCCSQNACASGCPRDRLVPAKLSEIENNRLDFLHPRSEKTTSSASETASATASSTSAANADDDEGLSTGATAGIAVGASVGGLFVLAMLAWLFWLRPRQKKKSERALQAASTAPALGPAGSDHPQSPMSGPIHQGTFATHSPMSGYQQSFNSTPTVMNPHHSGISSNDQFQKYSPQFSQSERPQSYAQFSDHGSYANSPGLPPYQQPYQQQHMVPVQEMDGTTTVRQEMSAGPEHHMQRNPSIGPEILNVQQPQQESK